MLSKKNIQRIIIYVVALFVLGFGIATIIAGSFGMAPSEALMGAIAKAIGKPFGKFMNIDLISIFTFIFGVFITVISFFIKKIFKKESDWKLFLNIIAIFGVSLSIALGKVIWEQILPPSGAFVTDARWVERSITVLSGIVLLSIGASALLITDLPVSPIDRFVVIVSDVTKKRVAIVKIVFDFVVLLIAFFILLIVRNGKFQNEVIGLYCPYINIFTIVIMATVGPLMDIFMRLFKRIFNFDKQKQDN